MNGPAPKATILDIKPYVPGKAKVAGFAAPIKLSANENALGCSPDARAAYLAAAASTIIRRHAAFLPLNHLPSLWL